MNLSVVPLRCEARPEIEAMLSGLLDAARAGRIRSCVVGYVEIAPGQDAEMKTESEGDTIDLTALAAMIFRSETDDYLDAE